MFNQLVNNMDSYLKYLDSDPYTAKVENGILTLKFKFPGYSSKDVSVTAKDNVIKVKIEKEGNWHRDITINRMYDVNNLKAIMKHGLLTINIPTSEEHKSKIFEITEGG